MELAQVDTATMAAAAGAADFSVWALFWKADIIVKTVMIMLVVASIWCWSIIIEKSIRLKRLNRDAADFEDLSGLVARWRPSMTVSARNPRIPCQRSSRPPCGSGGARRDSGVAGADRGSSLTERIDRVMVVTVNREVERIERQLTILASTGSTAPFIGLFGTVWGIMNSFQSIAISKNTSLAVVAPGIAEALFATALGLLAAIPAVIAYNKISKDMDRYAARLDDFSSEFSAIISRQLEGHS